MTAWHDRTVEERHLLNPAFCAVVLWFLAKGYRTERSELLNEQRALKATLERAKLFEGSSKGFTAEAIEHSARLGAVSIFEHDEHVSWFTNRNRPVLRFLIFDQLSKAHFPPDVEQPTEPQPSNADADHMAVKRLYDLIFEVVESLKGKFQVIVTDHPDFSDDARFQNTVREKWRGGPKLVPSDWPPASTAEKLRKEGEA